MINKLETEATGDFLLQALNLFIAKLDYLACAQVNQVVMMLFRDGLIARSAIAEIMPFDDAAVFKQLTVR